MEPFQERGGCRADDCRSYGEACQWSCRWVYNRLCASYAVRQLEKE